MRVAGLQALLTDITDSGSGKGCIRSAIGIGCKCKETFTAALGCVSGVVRIATRSGLCGFKVPSRTITLCGAYPLSLFWSFDRLLAS